MSLNEVTVQLPEPTPDDYFDYKWEVPLTDSLTGQLLTGWRAGEVCIRRSDGRISVTSVPSVLTTGGDAHRLAAALLAAADAYEAPRQKVECPGCHQEFDIDDGKEPVGMCRRCAGV